MKQYAQYPESKQHYYAVVTSMDEQMGRLRKTLRERGIAGNTMIWFCSDNGPSRLRVSQRCQGITGPYRDRKGSLYEGGIRVPGILEWPAMVKPGRVTRAAAVTSDYFPTILELLKLPVPHDNPLDGLSLVPVIKGEWIKRPAPIGFVFYKRFAWNDDRYKLLSVDNGETYELYDLRTDPGESVNVIAEHPDLAARMERELTQWRLGLRAD